MADRYSYVTAIGLFVMLGWAGAEFGDKTPVRRALAASSAGGVLAACALCAATQLRYWQNSETLFQHAITVNKHDFVAENNLGFYYDQHGDATKAEQCYRTALAINPGSTFALEKLATLLIAKDRNQEAAAACETALAMEPRMPDAHCTLGLALMKLGKRKEALDHYAEAIRIRPDFAPAHYNMANALAAQGQFRQALEHYRESVRWDPDSPDAHNNFAYLLVREAKLDEAVTEFRAALRLKANMWQADYGLADALSRQGNIKEAVECYRAALRARRDFPEALSRLAWILATHPDSQLRNGAEAASLAERACELTSYKQPNALRSLAAAYAELGRFTEAIECAEKAQSQAIAGGQKDLSAKLQELIESFRSGHPYREAGSVATRSP
jgi:tetratricopeptide (TPR) repeat protein